MSEKANVIDQPKPFVPHGDLLTGKIALVAGASKGIGAATCRILAQAGAAVGVLDHDKVNAQALVEEIVAGGGSAVPVIADLRDERDCDNAVDAVVRELGGVDILANVAGGMTKWAKWRPMTEWTTDSWDTIVHLNLRYPFWMGRKTFAVMKEHGGGSIINVSSIMGSFGCPNQAAYGAAKAGLDNLTKTMAVEMGPFGVRVNAVAPAVTLTKVAIDTLGTERAGGLAAATPLRRLGVPDDIARSILFFASSQSDFITGQLLHVDGGVSVCLAYPDLFEPR